MTKTRDRIRRLNEPDPRSSAKLLESRGISDGRVSKFRASLLDWYAKNGSQYPWRVNDPYVETVATILLQRTARTTVAEFLPSFISVYPDWSAIASESPKVLFKVLAPLGLAKQRTATVRAVADCLSSNGEPLTMSQFEVLQEIKGVGLYIQSGFALYYWQQAVPLIDSSSTRVLERYFGPRELADIRHDPYLQALAWEVVDSDQPREVNWALLDFAEDICRRRSPACGTCPLREECFFKRS